MSDAITDRDLPEYLMCAISRYEREVYLAGRCGCCKEGADLPSVFGGCEKHGARARHAAVLFHHALAEFVEDVVADCAHTAINTDILTQSGAALPEWTRAPRAIGEAVLALAPACKTCRGTGFSPPDPWGIRNSPPCPDCSRGKAWTYWRGLEAKAGGVALPRADAPATPASLPETDATTETKP